MACRQVSRSGDGMGQGDRPTIGQTHPYSNSPYLPFQVFVKFSVIIAMDHSMWGPEESHSTPIKSMDKSKWQL